MLKFLQSRTARAASALILFQGVLLYSANRSESLPAARPLSEMPKMLGSWGFVEEGLVDDDTRSVLKADDLLNRIYASG